MKINFNLIKEYIKSVFTSSDKAVYDCNYVNTELDKLKAETLWTNQNPTSSFGTQDINVSLENYSYYSIIYRLASNDTLIQQSSIVPVGNGEKIVNHTWIDGAGEVLLFRTIRSTSQKISVEPCYDVKLNDGLVSGQVNTYLIPYKVIGYKTL